MRRPNLTWIWKRPEQPRFTVRVTVAGFGFLVATAVIGAVSLQQGTNVLVVMLGIFIGAITINFVSGWWALRRVEVRRRLPDAAVAGAPCVIHYTLRNARGWARAYCLRVSDRAAEQGDEGRSAPRDLEAFVPMLGPMHEVTLAAPVVWPRRGVIEFRRLSVSTRFPFGLFVKRRTEPAASTLVVYPRLMRVRISPWKAIHAADALRHGEGAADRPPGDDEFFGLRPYRHGDNPRRIHWRRTARTGEIIVREMSRMRLNQIWVVLNTHRSAADIDEAARVESALSGAATVICDVLDHGGKVGLVVSGAPVHFSPPGSGPALRSRLLRELAARPANFDDPIFPCVQRLTWPSRWRGPCILLSPSQNDDVRLAAGWLSRQVGMVMTFIPGASAFESTFIAPADARADWGDLTPVDGPLGPQDAEEVAA